MAAPLAKVSYVNTDWASLRDELTARIPVLTGGRWTDLNVSDLGIAIVELLIGLQDEQLFYLDKRFSESQLPTAVQRASVKNLLKLIGYDVPGYGAAGGQVTISVAPSASPPVYGTVNGHANSILIPKATVLLGQSDVAQAIPFYTTEDKYLAPPGPGGASGILVDVVQGQQVSPEVFPADGTASQQYVLRTQQVDRNLLIVKVGSSEVSALPWSLATTFLTAEAQDHVYQSFEDANGNVYVQFGDGNFGAIPQLGDNIYVYPVVTLGSGGNVAAGTITQVSSTVVDTNGNPVGLTATNVNAMTGGADPETIETAKRNGPALLSALFRAMSKNDYIALTESISGVDKANAWGEQEETHPNIKLINRVMVVFLALDTNGNLVNPVSPQYAQIQTEVQALLEERKPVTTRIVFKAPEWIDLLVTVTVAVDRTLYDPAIVASDVTLAIQDFFSYANVDFGQDARQSLVANLISNVAGVSWVTINLSQSIAGVAPDPNNYVLRPGTGRYETIPGFVDIPVSRWQVLRINDFDQNNQATLGKDTSGNVIPHVRVITTTNIDSPIPDPMPDPCKYGSS